MDLTLINPTESKTKIQTNNWSNSITQNTRKMKKLIILTLIIGLSNRSKAEGMYETDTIIVEFGDNSKLVIYVESDEDLKALEAYDINEMISELNMSIASSDDNTEYLQITDDSGTRFLKDTTIQVNDSRVKYYADEDIDDDEINISLGSTDIRIKDNDYDDYDRRDWRPRRNRSFDRNNSFMMDLGMNNWLEDGNFPDQNNQPYAVKPFGSWYMALRSVQKTPVGGALFINWGAGISWYNWKFENADARVIKNNTETDFVLNTASNVSGIKSKLGATYLNVEIVPMLDFSYGRRKVKDIDAGNVRITRYKKRGVRIGLGGYAGYRIASWSKFVFEEDGDRDKSKEKSNYFLNNVRYGVRAQFGIKGMDFFANYDLNEVFSAGNGPKLNAVSFGVTF